MKGGTKDHMNLHPGEGITCENTSVLRDEGNGRGYSAHPHFFAQGWIGGKTTMNDLEFRLIFKER